MNEKKNKKKKKIYSVYWFCLIFNFNSDSDQLESTNQSCQVFKSLSVITSLHRFHIAQLKCYRPTFLGMNMCWVSSAILNKLIGTSCYSLPTLKGS